MHQCPSAVVLNFDDACQPSHLTRSSKLYTVRMRVSLATSLETSLRHSGHRVLSLDGIATSIFVKAAVPWTCLGKGKTQKHIKPIILAEEYWGIKDQILEEHPTDNMSLSDLQAATQKKGVLSVSLLE